MAREVHVQTHGLRNHLDAGEQGPTSWTWLPADLLCSVQQIPQEGQHQLNSSTKTLKLKLAAHLVNDYF